MGRKRVCFKERCLKLTVFTKATWIDAMELAIERVYFC